MVVVADESADDQTIILLLLGAIQTILAQPYTDPCRAACDEWDDLISNRSSNTMPLWIRQRDCNEAMHNDEGQEHDDGTAAGQHYLIVPQLIRRDNTEPYSAKTINLKSAGSSKSRLLRA
jgi:hypothetical protein